MTTDYPEGNPLTLILSPMGERRSVVHSRGSDSLAGLRGWVKTWSSVKSCLK